MGGCGSAMRMPSEKRFRRAIKLYEVAEVQSLTNLFNRNKCFETGDSPLTLATQQGHEDIVTSLIRAGADVNKLDCNGRAAVHVASQFNDLQTLKILLENKADPNKIASDESTPLCIAAERGFVDIVEALLDSGADPNLSRESCRTPTALFGAVANGHSDCVSILLSHGADPNVSDVKGQSPLRIAILNGDVKCSSVLLKHELVSVSGNELSIAIQGNNVRLVSVLLDALCDVEAAGKTPPVTRPLIHATLRGAADIVEVLLRAGADVNAVDELGNTSLHVAVLSVVDPSWKNTYIARQQQTSAVTSSGRLPRHRLAAAAQSNSNASDGYVRCVMTLVQAGANVASIWQTFSATFPPHVTPGSAHRITFQQMVVCEVLTQAYGFQNLSQDQISNFVCRLLKIAEFGLVKLVYSAGVQPSQTEEQFLTSQTGNESYQVMRNYVRHLRHRPRTLQDLCRRQIRQLLSWNTLYLVTKLPLTDQLKDYLCIMDTDHYTDV